MARRQKRSEHRTTNLTTSQQTRAGRESKTQKDGDGERCNSKGGAVRKRFLHAANSMNEAYNYSRPSAFSRGIELQLGEFKLIIISGTASVGPEGQTLYKGDFQAQALRAFENARAVLNDAGADWHDVVKTTIFIKDIGTYYETFNEVRCAYFENAGLEGYPASTCVEAKLCRDDLLVEMELMAIVPDKS